MGNRPRFMTKDQMIGKLNEHLETLQNEVTAVKEQITELKKKR
jgi:chaperonin cofactor prefoldin